MKIFDLAQIASSLDLDALTKEIQPDEVVIVENKVLHLRPNEFTDQLNEVKKRAGEIYFCLNLETVECCTLEPNLFAGIFLSATLKKPESNRYEGVSWEHIGSTDFVDSILAARTKLSPIPTLVSFRLEKSDLKSLGPTIFRLYLEGFQTFLLEVEKPNIAIARQVREAFEYLEIAGAKSAKIYFLSLDHQEAWNALTLNPFSGPEDIHMDVSNRCTHSCHFCGLYAEDNIRSLTASTGRIPENIRKFMRLEIDPDRAIEMITALPWTTRGIQFGGVGDPMTHSHAVRFIEKARRRGLFVQVLSNMEYLEENDLSTLHSLGGHDPQSLHFIVNLSGPDAETYVRTRPKQSAATFDKVIRNLNRLSELRIKDGGRGVHFTLMCVVTKLNYKFAPEFVELAAKVKADSLWLKPLEIHTDWMHNYTLSTQELMDYSRYLRQAIRLAERQKIILKNDQVLLDILEQQPSTCRGQTRESLN